MGFAHRTATALFVLLASSAALGGIVRIEAHYHEQNFTATQDRLFVTAIADLGSISGVGAEDAVVTYLSVTHYIHDVGQAFSTARLTSPPDTVTPGNLFAGLSGGEHDPTRLIGTAQFPGGNSFTILENDGGLAVANFSGDEVAYGGSVIFNRRYILDRYEVFVVPAPPAAASLGFAALGVARRRRA